MIEVDGFRPMLEDKYKQEVAVYKNYKEKISVFREELANLEKEKDKLSGTFIFSYAVSLVSVFLLFFFNSEFKSEFLVVSIISVFVALYPAVLLWSILYRSNFLRNILSFGRFNKIRGLQKQIQVRIEELQKLKDASCERLKPSEEMVRDHYKAKLLEFFNNNLYKKRSGSQQFEEALSEFSSTIDDLSLMNSVFITTSIALYEYEDYLAKRTINHNLQAAKNSQGSASVRNFVDSFSEPKQVKELIAPEKLYRTPRKVNWEEINKINKLTGEKGEEMVLAIEKEFFESIGRKDLADRVRNIASEDGDGSGYDILSFFEDGREKYIEVKSTKASLEAPIYISRNELSFLKEHRQDSFIYRILVAGEDSKVSVQSSSEFLATNELVPTQYVTR